jgi:hypothetical protein
LRHNEKLVEILDRVKALEPPMRRAYPFTEAAAAHRESRPGMAAEKSFSRFLDRSTMWTTGRSRLWSVDRRSVTP